MMTSTKPGRGGVGMNAASGREVQLNIWIGITVKGDISQSNDTNGGSALTGAGGRKAMKVSAPIVMIGAVSPMARAMPMITPVRMPADIGQDVVAHRLPLRRADRVRAFADRLRDRTDRLARRDDHHRQDEQRERQAGGEDALAEAELVDEEAQGEQPYTIEGTPARLVMLISITSVTQFFGAYSSR